MAKRLKMNLQTGNLSELGGTDSLPHPGNFPLGSVESRAAARAMIQPGRLRDGDRGTFRCGCTFFVFQKTNAQGNKSGGLVQIIFPRNWRDALNEHTHDYEIVDDEMWAR